ncbi:MAG: mechanosensitive ion channel family protein [Leptolyngbyaceae bacterium]|nr:mechanosensitive ion channel family protein [Leptolyngbyaceae bacterium]
MTLASAPYAWGQKPLPLEINLPTLNQLLSRSNVVDLATGVVKLDGYEIFSIAAPAVAQKDQQVNVLPIQQRVTTIERQLNQIANINFDPQKLDVAVAMNKTSNLPVITANGQYLMTVTLLDAQLQGVEVERWADSLRLTIKTALLRARQERQPDYLVKQGLIAAGILGVMVLGSWILVSWQGYLKKERRAIADQINAEEGMAVMPADPLDNSSATLIKQQRIKQEILDLGEIQRWLLQLGQLGILGAGTFVILGLFPYTRWLQPIVWSTPLKILGILLGIYVLIRASYVLIDRFSGVLETGRFTTPATAHRLSLRVSTFSRVLKSGAAIVCVSIGVLSGLSIVGVNLVPLLAGAGIIGLGISFASQSLIKDMINGFFILLEDQYAVGDVIIVNKVGGFVENMNLRITQLRNNEGRLITIPNSEISIVENLSKDWSRVDLAITVAYGTDPDHALKVINQLSAEIYSDRNWKSKISEPPEVLGIDELDHTGILIRIWIKTQPLQQWAVAREFRRRLKQGMDREGIAIGMPQQSLSVRNFSNGQGVEGIANLLP